MINDGTYWDKCGWESDSTQGSKCQDNVHLVTRIRADIADTPPPHTAHSDSGTPHTPDPWEKDMDTVIYEKSNT